MVRLRVVLEIMFLKFQNLLERLVFLTSYRYLQCSKGNFKKYLVLFGLLFFGAVFNVYFLVRSKPLRYYRLKLKTIFLSKKFDKFIVSYHRYMVSWLLLWYNYTIRQVKILFQLHKKLYIDCCICLVRMKWAPTRQRPFWCQNTHYVGTATCWSSNWLYNRTHTDVMLIKLKFDPSLPSAVPQASFKLQLYQGEIQAPTPSLP